MIQKFIIHKNYPRLLLFFAGWGADETPFKDYHPEKSDYLICYDYRNLDFDSSVLEPYQEIQVLGWSMGVWAASQVLGRLQTLHNGNLTGQALPVLIQSTAINGTPYPIDEHRGIPPALYHATLNGLTGASLNKFLRRMCLNGNEYRSFLSKSPHRPLEELKEELIEIERGYTTQPAFSYLWNRAIIGEDDYIIPTENQKNAWKNETLHPAFCATDFMLEKRSNTAHYSAELFEFYLQNGWL